LEGLDHGGEFWLSEAQWRAIEPLSPKNQAGARRTDDRRVISGIIHVLKTGCRWQDCPAVYGPSTTGLQSLSPLDDARHLASVV
jgi:transposase